MFILIFPDMKGRFFCLEFFFWVVKTRHQKALTNDKKKECEPKISGARKMFHKNVYYTAYL